jgi:peptidyl-prolyl cis-trans isomerase A (cyclophilin A)
MRRAAAACTFALSPAFWLAAHAAEVAVCTDLGRFTIEVDAERAPLHAQNFLDYVDSGFYNGVVFHRVIAGFVIQTGGYDRGLRSREPADAIANESDNGLRNTRGSVGAARSANPNAHTSQFYVNLQHNPTLDPSGDAPGYTVFGRVSEGLEVIDRIAALPTRAAGSFSQYVPEPLVAVTSASILDRALLEALPDDAPAESLRPRIASAAADEAHGAVIETIDLFRSLCAEMDAALLFAEARASVALGHDRRAQRALDEYFALAGDSDPRYAEARALYQQVASESGPAAPEVRRMLANRCPALEAPAIPEGATATMAEMLDAQNAVRDFVAAGDRYLACVNQLIDDATLDLSSEQLNLLIGEHNATVARMEAVAAEYNQQRTIFLARD